MNSLEITDVCRHAELLTPSGLKRKLTVMNTCRGTDMCRRAELAAHAFRLESLLTRQTETRH